MAKNKNKASQKKSDGDEDRKIVCTNRRARHEYDVLDEIDCGIVLSGSEVKSIRNNKISIEEADDDEVVDVANSVSVASCRIE